MGQCICDDMCAEYLLVIYITATCTLFKQLEKTVSDVGEASTQSYEISALTDGNIISICLHHM